MFVDRSRYQDLPTVEVSAANGRSVRAVTLRRLPVVSGDGRRLERHERLDIVAQQQFGDPTRFWHIADANRMLDSVELVADRPVVILVPER